jgi:hypothetical protein
MKNSREKMGDDLNINWKDSAFGVQKYKRKTIGFGEFNKKTKEYK